MPQTVEIRHKYMEKKYRNSIAFVFNDKYENLLFLWFSLFKFVTVAAPDNKDTPTFKKYVTAESNFFQIH